MSLNNDYNEFDKDSDFENGKLFKVAIVFLVFAGITFIFTIVWKTALRSPWDVMSSAMAVICGASFTVGTATIVFSKCFPRGKTRVCQHCCLQLVLTFVVVLFGLVLIGSIMNSFQDKYSEVMMLLHFDEYADMFSIDSPERLEELKNRRYAMTAVFYALTVFPPIVFVVMCCTFDMHKYLIGLNWLWIFPTLIATNGLWITLSLIAITWRVPSFPYHSIFLETVPCILASTLVGTLFLLIAIFAVCCQSARHRNLLNLNYFGVQIAVITIIYIVLGFGISIFQVIYGKKSTQLNRKVFVSACEDWSVLENTCGSNISSGNENGVCADVRHSVWHYRYVIRERQYPHGTGTETRTGTKEGGVGERENPGIGGMIRRRTKIEKNKRESTTTLIEFLLLEEEGKDSRDNSQGKGKAKQSRGRKEEEEVGGNKRGGGEKEGEKGRVEGRVAAVRDGAVEEEDEKKRRRKKEDEEADDLPCYNLARLAATFHQRADTAAKSLKKGILWMNMVIAFPFFGLTFFSLCFFC